jgi:hypothetical protein
MSVVSRLLAQDDEPTCTLHWICRQLGHAGTDVSKIRYVEGLIANLGFPRPLPHLAHGGRISGDIHAQRSRWIRRGVEVWMGDYLPPAAAAALADEAAHEAAEEMDRNACHLQLVGGLEA